MLKMQAFISRLSINRFSFAQNLTAIADDFDNSAFLNNFFKPLYNLKKNYISR